MRVIIRKYTDADQKAARSVVLRGYEVFGFRYISQYDFDLDDLKKYYIESGGIFYVLEIDRRIVGTIAVIKKENTAELKRWYVDKDFQGKGYGSKLLDKAILFCKENGINKIEFETNKKFVKAHLLYKKRGFKIVREDDRSFYMEKELGHKII